MKTKAITVLAAASLVVTACTWTGPAPTFELHQGNSKFICRTTAESIKIDKDVLQALSKFNEDALPSPTIEVIGVREAIKLCGDFLQQARLN